MSESAVAENAPELESYFARQLVTQLRAMDSYGTYDTWTDCKVVDPMILTKERRREIPVVGDPDETTVSRVKAFYNALACSIEKECGKMTMPVINITHEGFGRALIIVGRLVVFDKTLRDVHRFGFSSLAEMTAEMEKITKKAVDMVNAYPDVAAL
jgi:probable nitrogen fixation protein